LNAATLRIKALDDERKRLKRLIAQGEVTIAPLSHMLLIRSSPMVMMNIANSREATTRNKWCRRENSSAPT
jgi:hypothetical protein